MRFAEAKLWPSLRYMAQTFQVFESCLVRLSKPNVNATAKLALGTQGLTSSANHQKCSVMPEWGSTYIRIPEVLHYLLQLMLTILRGSLVSICEEWLRCSFQRVLASHTIRYLCTSWLSRRASLPLCGAAECQPVPKLFFNNWRALGFDGRVATLTARSFSWMPMWPGILSGITHLPRFLCTGSVMMVRKFELSCHACLHAVCVCREQISC